MRVLLDTNILIYREKDSVTNPSIGNLFYWLDTLKHTKVIHPLSIQEVEKYKNSTELAAFKIKLQSYDILKTIGIPDAEFLKKIRQFTSNDNDTVDDVLLYETYLGKVDLLVTEDRKMHLKASLLGIEKKVYTINRFVSESAYNNPKQINYKMLAVQQAFFGNLNINDPFFQSLKKDYAEFNEWFNRKCDETAYICYNEKNMLQGFLYIKREDEYEPYNNISPVFSPKKRLKIGTFKVESTGFRLGERFIKIIFDNALQYKVDEIYVTIFKDRPDQSVLYDLFLRWGFDEWGTKQSKNGIETVLVKTMNYDETKTIKKNFPNISFRGRKLILPIYPEYHTRLLPDSILKNENEVDFIGNSAFGYALQKVYISWAGFNYVKEGDLILFYRMGDKDPKKYSSVITTLGVVEQIIKTFANKEDFLQHCQNRSVFSKEELESFWNNHSANLCVLKFVYVKSLVKKVTLEYLWDKNIIERGKGPRPFTPITDAQFKNIMDEAKTEIQFS